MSTASAENNRSSLSHFSPVGLEVIGEEFLMRRKEIKYFFHKDQLPALLELFLNDFDVLEIGHRRIQQYKSKYLDTSQRDLYLHHHNGHGNRYKFRFREYVDSGAIFFEIKQKQNTGITVKHRIPLEDLDSAHTNGAINGLLSDFTDYDLSLLPEQLTVNYDRIGLIHKDLDARITLDQKIVCNDHSGHHIFENLVILELKYKKSFDKYFLMKALRQMHLYPERISKYCMSTCKLHPEMKQNRFKRKLMRIDQIKNSRTI